MTIKTIISGDTMKSKWVRAWQWMIISSKLLRNNHLHSDKHRPSCLSRIDAKIVCMWAISDQLVIQISSSSALNFGQVPTSSCSTWVMLPIFLLQLPTVSLANKNSYYRLVHLWCSVILITFLWLIFWKNKKMSKMKIQKKNKLKKRSKNAVEGAVAVI